MKLLVKGGRVIDPASGRDAVGDVAVADGRIVDTKVNATRAAPRDISW